MKFSEQIASELHEVWRKTRLRQDGSYEPRWKKVKDIEFVKNLDLANLPETIRITPENDLEIDIANTSYQDLSEDWKAENKAAGEVVANLLSSDIKYSRSEIGQIIHSEWLKRNKWATNDPVLSLPFDQLPEEEQKKDLNQYDIGVALSKKDPSLGK